MVSIYVKALVITLVLFVGNFFLVKYLDESRAQALQTQFDELQQEIQSSQLVLLYSQTSGNPRESCPILENAGLWLYLQQLNSLCGQSPTESILYFYPESNNPFCIDCKTQAEILNQVRDECKNVRI